MNEKTKGHLAFFALVGLGFFVLQTYLSRGWLLIGLNGVFVGSLVGLVVSYSQLVGASIMGKVEERDVDRFTRAMVLIVAGICCAVWSSVQARITGATPRITYTASAMARYLWIVGFTLMVYAPDAGQPWFHGRDRRVLAISVGLGFLAAVITIWAQAFEVLE